MIPILKKWVAIITANDISKIKVTIGEIYFLSIDMDFAILNRRQHENFNTSAFVCAVVT